MQNNLSLKSIFPFFKSGNRVKLFLLKTTRYPILASIGYLAKKFPMVHF